ncbi:hypothetical protein NA57DRAFT_64051 [Rhizodiscina lignyota]|uniref:Cell morphogenesis protein n=1 Tax=Rhizodiscina lignyota TaxID=1504668 RepID=A0A9P4IL69_9PEZI|nr:hypothetical protein NA57DRAFT_64051 [Rhizodiscina lignyota]
MQMTGRRRAECPSLSSYGHHRQTSIVHGMPHSRNASFVTNPLSPQIISEGVPFGGDGYAPGDDIPTVPSSINSTLTSASAAQMSSSSLYSDRTSRQREPPHSRSQSRAVPPSQTKLRTVGEFALHHLFTAFVSQALIKINKCSSAPQGPEPKVEQICGPRVDAEFDQLIWALGHVARQEPKPMIDTLMLWRQSISGEANAAREALNNAVTKSPGANGMSIRRFGQQPNYSSATLNGGDGYRPDASQAQLQLDVIQAERRSTVSIYLLCRVFIEIISQTTLGNLTVELSYKLEDIIFTQLKQSEPETLEQSPLKLANWNIFGQLLGVMSGVNFESVAGRFLKDLEVLQSHMQVKATIVREIEGRAVLLVRGMKHLRLKTVPDAAWEQTCKFMHRLTIAFNNCHGHSLKYAYCQLFEDLLVPIAAQATVELNSPKWKHVVEDMRLKLYELVNKPKHWLQAFPTLAVQICASPTEAFATHWLQLLPSVQARLKERASRGIALRGLCRLLWRYIYHGVDPPNQTLRRLEEIKAMVFLSGKKTYLSTETAIAEPLIQLVRIIGFRYQDFAFKQLIFPLMNSDVFLSGREHKVESLEPEKMVIGIRAFLAIMADLENATNPPFPVTFYSDTALERFESASMPLSPKPLIPTAIKTSTVKEDRLSRPVMVQAFGEVAKESYIKFCKILGEITIICDNTFGGQAVLDEKFGNQTPKTPMTDAFSFSRKDDHLSGLDVRQGFYDLLHVAVQALPRCLSPHIPFNSLINLLCTGTAHVQNNIATSSAQSLKSIARQSHAQQVTIGFARFIFNFDDRYATMSDGGMLGTGHIESTLRLYVELLNIWIEEIKTKTKKNVGETSENNADRMRAAGLDLHSIWAHVDEIESHGLFFLCSPSRRVRAVAVTVLRLVTEFDTALGTDSTRIITVLEGNLQNVIDVHDEKLSVAERSRLQRGIRDGQTQNTLVELCSSDTPHDSTLWFKVFPNLVRISLEVCPMAVALTRESICARISQMQRTVASLVDGTRTIPYTSYDLQSGKMSGRLAATSPEVIIEQWKLYLIFACTTLPSAGGSDSHAQGPQHTRKSSKSSQKSVDKVGSAGRLFNMVLPLLTAPNDAIRDAIVVGLGSINQGLYRILLETLQPMVVSCHEEAKQRIAHQRTPSSSVRGSRRTDVLRTEITHIYKLTSHFLQLPESYNDEWILNNLVNFTKDLRLFLNDVEVQNEYEFQKLRTHYCGLIEQLYEGISKTKDPMRWMPFQSRKAAFTLMEDWCGYSPNQPVIRQREETMRRSYLDRESYRNQNMINARMEIEKRNLRTAALSAMAVLCGGPISITTDSKTNLQFDVNRLLSWIDSIFEDVSDRTHTIGRRALKNVILHNTEHNYLMDRAIEMCYTAKSPKSLESYFEVVREILLEHADMTQAFSKMLPACLYILGNEQSILRTRAARLLRSLEEREQNISKLQDLDISVSDKTIAVYKNAQFEVSHRLSQLYGHLAPFVFAEFSRYFKDLQPDHQRNLVAAMLPWIQAIELQVEPSGEPTSTTYMLLVNLFEITVRCGTVLHNEIQALWQALATGPHAGNVRLILDFIINLCLEKKEQNFVDYSRQIVVYLSGTPAGSKVVEFLLMQIEPKAMVFENKDPFVLPPEAITLPYFADLNQVLPVGNKSHGFSLGQLSLILLVDLMVAPVQLPPSNVTLLLQVVLILWDNYTGLVQEQAREMLVHLIHELILSKIDDNTPAASRPNKQYIEGFIDSVRRGDGQVVWGYDDYNDSNNKESGLRVPEQMRFVAEQVVQIFSTSYPGIREEWAKTSLAWATTCSVRHLACRSFQLYRSIFSSLEPNMLCDMLARLSNTIAADETEILTFSMEILSTLRTIIDLLPPGDLIQYPQLFWTTCACLNTTHEQEFTESLAMLEVVLDKLDLGAPPIIQRLEENRPLTWDGHFEGLSSFIYKGVRSSVSMDKSLMLLEKLVVLPTSSLVGDDDRLAFTVLANLPRYLHSFDHEHKDRSVLASAETLANVAEKQGRIRMAQVLKAFAGVRYRSENDFLAQAVASFREWIFQDQEYQSLIFLLSLLTNSTPWFKIKTMQVLCVVIPEIDMQNPDIASKGPDLISPLLRLLQTEFCPQALQVLDNVMNMATTPMDKHHMRMSMAGSHSSRATRKEYEKTISLYGIPHESGWAIPIPANQSTTTRNNVHAVYYTCASGTTAAPPEDTPKIELVSEDPHGGYFPEYRATSTISDESSKTGQLNDIMAKLDSLDDFFDEDNFGSVPGEMQGLAPSPVESEFPHEPMEPREDIYDQQTFPLLHKSLARNTSVTSFQNGFTDNKSPSRDGNIMTPGAFNVLSSPSTVPTINQPAFRPGMHSRSITSPALNQRTPPGTSIELSSPDANFTDGTVSDDEAPVPTLTRSHTSNSAIDKSGAFPTLENVLKPAAQQARSGFRSGIRRLTGGSADARDVRAIREAIRSPKVPKVPDMYLQGPKSGEP